MKKLTHLFTSACISSMLLLAACSPNSADDASSTTNSGGEGATDISRVPATDSSVLSNDSSGVHGDTTNLQR